MKNLKEFSDLEFSTHPMGVGKQAKMFFDNGYGVSVVGGGIGLYGDGKSTWELAVLVKTNDGFDLCYDTPVTGDVIGHIKEFEVTNYMAAVQNLPPIKDTI